jgi:hypothetical protein
MTEIDPLPYNALAVLRAEASIRPRPSARRATLAAVHAAVAAAPAPRRWRRTAVLAAVMRHPLALATTAAAAAVVAVIGLGWNAPPGSPLHDVRLARERVALALAHDPTGLRLSYAEDRLRDAHSASNPAPYLSEANDLLKDVGSALPASTTDPLRVRWASDERQLSDEIGGQSSPSGIPAGTGGAAGAAATPRASGSEDHAPGSGRPAATPSPGEGEQRHPSPTGPGPTGPTPSGGDGSEHHPSGTPGPNPTPPPDN